MRCDEYSEIVSDVPRVTHLIEHKVDLTETEPVKHKPYPIPYKMQEIIDKEQASTFICPINKHRYNIDE